MKRILLILLLITWGIRSIAQPTPCELPPTMTSFCDDACVICDIDGFTGRHQSTILGEAPPGFAGECTIVLHNAQWIAFIAGSSSLSVELSVSNCQLGYGLEFGLYAGDDCDGFRRISNCFGGAVGTVGPGQSGVVTTNEQLVIGQYYYLVMDGALMDNCDWTFSVVEGSTEVMPIEAIDSISGPTTICPNVWASFEVPEREAAAAQEWTVNGELVLEGDPIFEWRFDAVGDYTICYAAYNVCDTMPTVCKQVTVAELSPISINESICDDDCLLVADTMLCDDGFHNFIVVDADSCLQEYLVNIDIIPPAYNDLDITFCFGDSITIGTESFFETGNYVIPIETTEVCDSIVRLDLTTFLCDINGGFSDDSLLCHGRADGELQFNLLDGELPFQYEWEEIGGTGLIGLGTSSSGTNNVVIPNLSVGIYSVTIIDGAGSLGIFVGQIFEPTALSASTNLSDYNGFNISCPEMSDGSIEILATGGTPSYRYLWENGLTGALETNLADGDYSISVVDANGCEFVINENLTTAEVLELQLDLLAPVCEPENSASIEVVNASGGTAPYLFSLNEAAFVDNTSFENLLFGEYDLVFQDANGCEMDTTIIFTDPNTLILALGRDTTICLGDSILLNPFTNIDNVSYSWSASQGINCLDCEKNYVRPFNTTVYSLTTTMENDCSQTDSLMVSVIDKRNVYVPNAFSPNGDGHNDYLTISAGPEVAQVLSFRVFNRWGAVVSELNNFQANQIGVGWDGNFKGEAMNVGIYVWIAEVQFLDGEIINYKGDVLLLK